MSGTLAVLSNGLPPIVSPGRISRVSVGTRSLCRTAGCVALATANGVRPFLLTAPLYYYYWAFLKH